MATSDTSRADGPPPFCAKVKEWVERHGKSDGAQIFAVVDDVPETLFKAAMRARVRRINEAMKIGQSHSVKTTLTAIHDSGVYETWLCDAEGTPCGASTFSKLVDKPVVTHGDVVLQNDERARRNMIAGKP